MHLLVVDGDAEVVPQSLQLVAGKQLRISIGEKNEKVLTGMIDTMQRR